MQISTALVFPGAQGLLAGNPDLRQEIVKAIVNFYGPAEVRDLYLLCTNRPRAVTGFDVFFAVAPTARHTTIKELKTALAMDPESVFPTHFLYEYGVPDLRMTSKLQFLYIVFHCECCFTLLLLYLLRYKCYCFVVVKR